MGILAFQYRLLGRALWWVTPLGPGRSLQRCRGSLLEVLLGHDVLARSRGVTPSLIERLLCEFAAWLDLYESV